MPDSARRIVVFGEALVDVFDDQSVLGGAPFNVARNLASFGLDPLMITRVGADALGDRIDAEFALNGMDTAGLQRDARHATGRVTVSMVEGAHRFAIDADAAWDHLCADDFLPIVRSSSPTLAYFGTLAQRNGASRKAIRRGLAETGAKRFLDLNLRGMADEEAIAAESLALADIVKVNDEELEQLVRWFGSRSPLSARHRAGNPVAGLMDRFELQRVVVTCGDQGWFCHDRDHSQVLEGGAATTQVCDTVGAGDAFSSVLLLGEVLEWSLACTLQRAAEFAAQVCAVRGGYIGANSTALQVLRRL